MIFKKAFITLDSNRVMLVQSFIEITFLKVSFLLRLVIQEFRCFFFSYTFVHGVCVNSLTPTFICTAISDFIMCISPYIYDERSVGNAIVP